MTYGYLENLLEDYANRYKMLEGGSHFKILDTCDQSKVIYLIKFSHDKLLDQYDDMCRICRNMNEDDRRYKNSILFYCADEW